MIENQHHIQRTRKTAKLKSTAPKPEILVFRLKRDLDDKEADVIVVNDAPRKRRRQQQPIKKLTSLFQSCSIAKEKPCQVLPTLKQSQLDASKNPKRILRRLTLEALSKENGFTFFTERVHEDKRKQMRSQLLSLSRGENYDQNLVRVCDIDNGKFMVINGQKVPFKNIIGNKATEDYFILDNNVNGIATQNCPVLECPKELDSDYIESDNDCQKDNSPIDSEDSNAEDHVDNDYPDEQDQMNHHSGDDYGYNDRNYRYNHQQSDQEQVSGFDDQFYKRYIKNKERYKTTCNKRFDSDDDIDSDQ